MSWLADSTQANDGADDFTRTFGLRPNLFATWQTFESRLWSAEGARPEIYALCRARMAQMNGARALPGSPGPALPSAKLDTLDAWWKSDAFAPLERACLGFAEQYVLDPGGIGDDLARPVVDVLGDAGTVAFVEALAIFDGFTRFCAMLDIEPSADPSAEPNTEATPR